MNLFVLISVSIGLGLVGLAAFYWAMRNGQFDDPDGAAWRIVYPQDPPPHPEASPHRKRMIAEAHERHAAKRS